MRNFRYIHFVARFKDRYISGVVDAAPQTSPVEVHDNIQLNICKKWHLSELHKDDIVIEKMEGIE